MSWIASGWAKRVTICPDGKKIRRSEKFLLLILSDYHNEKLKTAWASMKTLAEDGLMSERNARYIIRRLEAHRLIETVPGGPGTKGTNSYTFPQLDGGAKIAPSVGQRLPHKKLLITPGDGANRRCQVGQISVGGGAIAFAPKQEETSKKPKEEGPLLIKQGKKEKTNRRGGGPESIGEVLGRLESKIKFRSAAAR